MIEDEQEIIVLQYLSGTVGEEEELCLNNELAVDNTVCSVVRGECINSKIAATSFLMVKTASSSVSQ